MLFSFPSEALTGIHMGGILCCRINLFRIAEAGGGGQDGGLFFPKWWDGYDPHLPVRVTQNRWREEEQHCMLYSVIANNVQCCYPLRGAHTKGEIIPLPPASENRLYQQPSFLPLNSSPCYSKCSCTWRLRRRIHCHTFWQKIGKRKASFSAVFEYFFLPKCT